MCARVYACSSSFTSPRTRYVPWKNLVITSGSVKNVFSVRLPTEKLHRDKKESRLLLLYFFFLRADFLWFELMKLTLSLSNGILINALQQE